MSRLASMPIPGTINEIREIISQRYDIDAMRGFISRITPEELAIILKSDEGEFDDSEHKFLIEMLTILPKDDEIQRMLLSKIDDSHMKTILYGTVRAEGEEGWDDFEHKSLISLLEQLNPAQQKTILEHYNNDEGRKRLSALLKGDDRIETLRNNYFRTLAALSPAHHILFLNLDFVRTGSPDSLTTILALLRTPENQQYYLGVLKDNITDSGHLLTLLGKNHNTKTHFLDFPTRKALVISHAEKFPDAESKILDLFNDAEKAEIRALLPFTVGLEKLKQKFIEVNDRRADVDEFQTRDPENFFYENHRKILLLYECMGNAAFKWMSDQLAFTVLPLERLLEGMPGSLEPATIGWLRECFNQYATKPPTKADLEHWQNILIGVSTQLGYNKTEPIRSPEEQMRIYRTHTGDLKSLSNFVNRSLLNSIYDGLKLSPETRQRINIDNVFAQIPMTQFAQLAKYKKEMKADDPHALVLSGIIECYLKGESITAFLHDQMQSSPLGQKLATHNKKIRDILTQKGIDPATALQYQKTYEFSYEPPGFNESIDLKIKITTIVSNIVNMKSAIQSVTSLLAPLMAETAENTKLKSQLTALVENIDKLVAANRTKLFVDPNLGILRKTQGTLIALLATDPIKSDPRFDVFRWAASELSTFPLPQKSPQSPLSPTQEERRSTSASPTSPSSPSHTNPTATHFRVEQWDKEKISTLFLGNEVDCCLAIGGMKSDAIVQRIMDDAMLFHVVVDMETQKPIALTWAYLATDLRGDVILVGNFVEIKTKYTTNPEMHETIINALMHFSGEVYGKDNPNIKGFAINRLGYGFNMGKIPFSEKPLVLVDKVGGALSLEQERTASLTERQTTCQRYYLQSLQRSIGNPVTPFHVYNPDELTAAKRAAFVDVESKILQIVQKYAQPFLELSATNLKGQIEDAVKQEIIVRGMDVFFNGPNDPKLTAMLDNAYRTITTPQVTVTAVDTAQSQTHARIAAPSNPSETSLVHFLRDAVAHGQSDEAILHYLRMVIAEKGTSASHIEKLLIQRIGDIGTIGALDEIKGLSDSQIFEALRLSNAAQIPFRTATQEIPGLNRDQLDILSELYHAGLRGQHLRLHVGRFNHLTHARALKMLIEDNKVPVEVAVSMVSGLSDMQACTLRDNYQYGVRSTHLKSIPKDSERDDLYIHSLVCKQFDPDYRMYHGTREISASARMIATHLIILAKTEKALEQYDKEVKRRESLSGFGGLVNPAPGKDSKRLASALRETLNNPGFTAEQKVMYIKTSLFTDASKTSGILTDALKEKGLIDSDKKLADIFSEVQQPQFASVAKH